MMKMMLDVEIEAQTMTIGTAMYNLALAEDGGEGPGFTTCEWNPRVADKHSKAALLKQMVSRMGGLVRTNPEYAILFGIYTKWIANLEEIQNWQPGQPIPRIVWTEEAKGKKAELINGNHRYQLLLDELAGPIRELEDVKKRLEVWNKKTTLSKANVVKKKADEGMLAKVTAILADKGLFTVKLINLGETYFDTLIETSRH